MVADQWNGANSNDHTFNFIKHKNITYRYNRTSDTNKQKYHFWHHRHDVIYKAVIWKAIQASQMNKRNTYLK